jgi:mannose-1-phosphate guanylyltransferase
MESLGVQEALVNTHHLAPQVQDFFEKNRYAVRVKLFHEEKLLGSAGTIAANQDFVQGERDFWILYADTWVLADLKPLVPLHRRGAALTLGLFKSPDPRSCGIVELDADQRVVSFEEKPAQPKSDLAAAGVYLGGKRLLREISQAAPRSDEGLDISKHILPRLIGEGMRGLLLSGRVLDIGTPANYALAQKL